MHTVYLLLYSFNHTVFQKLLTGFFLHAGVTLWDLGTSGITLSESSPRLASYKRSWGNLTHSHKYTRHQNWVTVTLWFGVISLSLLLSLCFSLSLFPCTGLCACARAKMRLWGGFDVCQTVEQPSSGTFNEALVFTFLLHACLFLSFFS